MASVKVSAITLARSYRVGCNFCSQLVIHRKRFRARLLQPQYSNLSTGPSKLWWPEAVEMIGQLPEIAEAKEACSQGNYNRAESSLKRAKDICISAFGADHATTASVLVAMTKVHYSVGNAKDALKSVSTLSESKAVTSHEKIREVVKIAYMKLILDSGYDEKHWSRLQLILNSPYESNSDELNSISCLVDLLWNPALAHNNADFETAFKSWNDTHETLVSRLGNEPAKKACHLYNMGTGIWTKYIRDTSLVNSMDTTTLSLLKTFTVDNLLSALESLKEESTSLIQIMEADEDNINSVCSLVSKENPDLARRIALIFNMLAIQNPKEDDSQLLLSKALALVQDLENDGDEYKAILALVLSSLARSLHLNGKALSSEGLYRSAFDKLSSLRPQRNKYQVTSINILRNYSQLLHGWEKREADEVSISKQAETIKNKYSQNCVGIEFDRVVNWGNLCRKCSFIES